MLWLRVVTAVVLLAIVLPTIFLLPPVYWGAVTLVFLAAAAWEWRRLQPNRPGGAGLAAVLVLTGAVWLWLSADTGIPAAGMPVGLRTAATAVLLLAIAYWLLVAPLRLRAHRVGSGGPVPVYLLLLACWLALFELRQLGPAVLVSAMALVWIADIGAYFVGRGVGRRKLAPRISPGKTWEGAVGGAFFVVVTGLLIAPYPGPPTFATALISHWGPVFGAAVLIVLSAMAVLGDLHESQLKREAGEKDSGKTLPGHGGVLDRIDALVPVMPAIALLYRVLG